MKKNILIIVTNLKDGGAERNAAMLANMLNKNNNVIIATFDNTNQEYYTNVEIIDLKTKNTNNCLKKFSQMWVAYKKIKKIKNDNKIQYSISFLTVPNLINSLTKNEEKVIISIRNYLSMSKHKVLSYILNKITCKKADKIVCVSDSVKNNQMKIYKVDERKLVTIPNSYRDLEGEFNPKYQSDIITIGRLIDQKGQWHLIKALKEVVKIYPNVKLLILGRGNREKYLKKLIHKNKLEDNIDLIGFKENPYDYLVNSKIFVLPSVFEGMPNVVLEAMKCELPIIATDCYGGNREIIHPELKNKEYIKQIVYGEYGVLVPNMGNIKNSKLTKKEKCLAESIIKMLEDTKLQKIYKEKSKERAKDFSPEKMLEKWIRILN